MPGDYITNNPNPAAAWASTAQEILSLAETMAEGDVKASMVRAAISLTNAAMKPELLGTRIQAELEKLNMGIQAKAAAQGATLADKAAARAMDLQLATLKGDRRQVELEMKNLHQLSILGQKQAGDLNKMREAKGLDIEREKLKQSGQKEMFTLKDASQSARETAKRNDKLDWWYLEREAKNEDEKQKLADQKARERESLDRARRAAINGPNDPVLETIKANAGSASPAFQEELSEVVRMANKQVDVKIARALAMPEIRDGMRQFGIKYKEIETPLREHTIKTMSPLRFLEDKIDEARAAASTSAEGKKIYFETKAGLDAHNVPEPIQEPILKEVAKKYGYTPEATQDMAKAAAIAEGKGLASKARMWRGAKGVGAALALAYLGSKFMGGDGEKPVDPQLQMMLMQQMAQQQGGAGDEAKAQGQELMNLSRTLNIMKTLQSMQGSQMNSPVSMAGLM